MIEEYLNIILIVVVFFTIFSLTTMIVAVIFIANISFCFEDFVSSYKRKIKKDIKDDSK